jgi:predicted RNA binding protein YcfA (HicA-like mRNA interferase family)
MGRYNLTAKEIVRLLEKDGWREVRQKGSHKIFQHATKIGNVTVPMHGGTLKTKTAQSIFKQAQINDEAT